MIKPTYPMQHYFESNKDLEPIEVPKAIGTRRHLLSKGVLNLYKGEGIEKLARLYIRGMFIYQYDFGIAYPQEGQVYPLFLYQIIIAHKRVLALVHFPFDRLEEGQKMMEMENALKADEALSDILLKPFEPQAFLKGDILPNHFNGLVRTTDIDHAYHRIHKLFQLWHGGLKNKGPDTEDRIQSYRLWQEAFIQRFESQDYGYTVCKRFLGTSWTDKVFKEYLFSRR